MENLFDLSGKVAIVTGGNGGIGKGIADGLAQAGSDIVVAARNESKTAEAVRDIKEKSGVRVLGVQVDVRQEDSIKAMVKQVLDEFGQINILVNNAGINTHRKMPQYYEPAEWDEILEVNLRGPLLCSKAVYPSMKEAGGGKIINTGSMTSLFGGAKWAAYACSKAGIVQLTYSLALAWAEDNIQVNAILPGFISTSLSVETRKIFPNLDDHVIHRTPAGRWGQPSDLAGAAVFLASRASDFVTAEYIKTDGGYAQGGLII
ncbi:SDR family NAD(P)-dependent oxidoreductase [Chloroflexota bacterium]